MRDEVKCFGTSDILNPFDGFGKIVRLDKLQCSNDINCISIGCGGVFTDIFEHTDRDVPP